jgi:hypothetical protein
MPRRITLIPRSVKHIVPKARKLAAAILLAAFQGTAVTVSAGDLHDVKQRLLAARKHAEMDGIYRDIHREFRGDVAGIVGFLKKNGFSCWADDGYFKARCVLAYCGDRSAFVGFRKRLMSVDILITIRGADTAVAHQPIACPGAATALRQIQEKALTGENMHRRE